MLLFGHPAPGTGRALMLSIITPGIHRFGEPLAGQGACCWAHTWCQGSWVCLSSPGAAAVSAGWSPGGDIAPWVVLVAETLLLPSRSTKISTSFLSVYCRERCKVLLFLPNITNYDSLGRGQIKMPNSVQGKQGVLGTGRQEWPFCVLSEGGLAPASVGTPPAPAGPRQVMRSPPRGAVYLGWGSGVRP